MKRNNLGRRPWHRPGLLVDWPLPALLRAGSPNPSEPKVILHPTDFSVPARQAFELVCQIARSRGSRLLVMNVAELVRLSSLGMAPVPPLPQGYRGAWESRLRRMQPRDSTIPVEYRVEEGDVADAILRVARDLPCNAIVMGSRERTGLGRFLQGSITRKVERQAPCPVLRLNTPQATTGRDLPVELPSYRRDDMLEFRTILHPTDFSGPSMYAFGLARALAQASNCELLVIHVAPVEQFRRHGERRKQYEALRRLTATDETVRMRSLLLEGDASSQIVSTASQLDCDLIVMGSKGHTGLKGLLLGSVAKAVRRNAPCPVMTVQLPAREGWDLLGLGDEESLLTESGSLVGAHGHETNGRYER